MCKYKIGPGRSVVSSVGATSTITCFVYRPADVGAGGKKLYAVVAGHAVKKPSGFQTLKIMTSDEELVSIGRVLKVTDNLKTDCALIELPYEITSCLTEANFQIFKSQIASKVSGVWDPLRPRVVAEFPDGHEAVIEDVAYKDLHIKGFHGGARSSPIGKASPGAMPITFKAKDCLVPKAQIPIYGKITDGDSGGPVFDSGNNIVGMISQKFEDGTGGHMVLCGDIFEELGLSLATWDNKEQWLGNEPQPSPSTQASRVQIEDSDEDGSSEEITWEKPKGW